jgi:P27 family predicted phage terminase small subunit
VTDLPALSRLFLLRDQRDRFAAEVDREPLVEGSQGQRVANPLARLVSTADSEIRQLEDRFGLSPQARFRLGISLVEATKAMSTPETPADAGRFKNVI